MTSSTRARILPFAAAVGIVLILAYQVYTWRSFITAIGFCDELFCDFIDYYFPMGEAAFRTAFPVPGFLYSPFIAILLAVFPPLGLESSLIFWGILQVLSVIVFFYLFRRLVPAPAPIQLLFIALTLSSYPLSLNFLAGQVSVFMMASLLGLLVLYQRGHRVGAAALLAFATSFKFFPIIFLVPFLAQRDIRFLTFTVMACVAFLFVVPGGFLGIGDTLRFYGGLGDAFRESDWVVANPHSQYFPHVILRLMEVAGYDAHGQLWLLRWIGFGVAAANVGLLFLIQRAGVRHADLWSFQLLLLTIPFILKTSWPHDFVFLTFIQTFLAWWLLERGETAPGAKPMLRAVPIVLLLVSIAISNMVFFSLFGDFHGYGSCSFLFWANLFLLMAMYLELLPIVVGRLPVTARSPTGSS